MTILGATSAQLQSSPTRWYIVFCSAARRRWWDAVFRSPPGFEHVYAIRWDGWNWLVFSPHTAYTDVAIAPLASENAWRSLVVPGATVLEVEAFRSERIRGRWWIGPMTCVEQVKALLGLPVAWVFTPWQLYRYLISEGLDGQQAENATENRAGSRIRAPAARRAERSAARRKRTPEGNPPREPRTTIITRRRQ